MFLTILLKVPFTMKNIRLFTNYYPFKQKRLLFFSFLSAVSYIFQNSVGLKIIVDEHFNKLNNLKLGNFNIHN